MNTNKSGLLIIGFLILLVVGCASPGQPQATATPLPSPILTRAPVQLPVSTSTVTITLTSPPLPTSQAGCTHGALYVEDVTIPDNTNLKPGEAFTKTWRLRNKGTCTWNIRYALVFVGGDQMGAAVTTPLSETPQGQTLDISVNLTAPSSDGVYTGLYELRTPTGKPILIGSVTSIWVKITVGKRNLPTVTPTASQ
jgi:hypothetical protein